VVQFPGCVFGFIFFRSLAYCNGAWRGAIGSGYTAPGCKGASTE